MGFLKKVVARWQTGQLGRAASVALQAGKVEEAIQYFTEAFALAQERGDQEKAQLYLGFLGNAYQEAGRFKEAIRCHQSAVQMAVKVNMETDACFWYYNLGRDHLLTDQFKAAMPYYLQALRVEQRLESEREIFVWIESLRDLGILLTELGDTGQAEKFFAQALAVANKFNQDLLVQDITRHIGKPSFSDHTSQLQQFKILHAQAEQAHLSGHYEQAIAKFEDARQLASELGEQALIWASTDSLANALSDSGQYEKALPLRQAFLQMARKEQNLEAEGFACSNLANLLQHLTRYDEAIEHSQRAISIAVETGDLSAEILRKGNLGILYLKTTNLHRARPLLEEVIRSGLGKVNIGRYRGALALVERDLNNAAEAETCFRAAVAECRSERDLLGESEALTNFVDFLSERERFDLAHAHLQRLKQIGEHHDNPVLKARVLQVMGTLYGLLGRFSSAESYLNQALQLCRDQNNQMAIAQCLNNYGIFCRQQGKFDKAFSYLQSARQIALEERAPELQKITITNLIKVFINLGDIQGAFKIGEEGLPLIGVVITKEDATLLHVLGDAFFITGHLNEALSFFSRALAMARQCQSPIQEGINLSEMGRVYLELGDYESAITNLEHALTVLATANYQRAIGAVLYGLGIAHHNLGHADQAEQYWRQALGVQKMSSNFDSWKTRHHLGKLTATRKQFAAARSHLQEAVKLLELLGDGSELDSFWPGLQGQGGQQLWESLIMVEHLDNRSDKVFEVVEQSRSRTLRRLLAPSRLSAPVDIPAAIKRDEIMLLGERRTLFYQVHRPGKKAQEIMTNIEEVDCKIQELWRSIETTHPEYVNMRQGNAFNYTQIKECLQI